MSVHTLSNKLLYIFEKIFKDKYELSDYHAECLIQYLEDLVINGINGKILETAFFTDIVLGAIDIYNSVENRNVKDVPVSSTLFFLKLVSIMYSNELQFNKVVQIDSYEHISEVMCNPTSCVPYCRIQLACTKIVTAQLAHYSGICWLVKKKIWTCIICPCTYKKPNKYATSAYNFMSRLIWKLNEFEDVQTLAEILEFVLRPITDSEYQRCVALEPDEEFKIYSPMMSYLNALLTILQDENILKPNKVLHLLTSKFLIELHLQLILEATRDENLASILSDISFKLYTAVIKDLGVDNTSAGLMNQIVTDYCRIIQNLIKKRMIKAILSFTVRCNIGMAKYKMLLKFERDGQDYEFQTQFVLHIIAPLWAYFVQVMSQRRITLSNGEVLDSFHFKIQNVSPKDVIQSASAFKTLVTESENVQKAAVYTVKEFFNFKGQLNAAQAGILYQTLYYMLQIYVPLDDQGDLILNNTPLTFEDVQFLSHILAAIEMLLKEHDLTWYENYEVICLQTCLMNFLKLDSLPMKLRLQAIELIELCVKKFLSPALILLTESKRGSTLSEVAAVTKGYILSEEWEIRDSALELLYTCTDLAFLEERGSSSGMQTIHDTTNLTLRSSNTLVNDVELWVCLELVMVVMASSGHLSPEYEPLQKLICENDLMVIAANCALQDPEYYVRATALKCLAAATKINNIWGQVLNIYQNLYDQLIDMVINNTEAIIRKGATHVLAGAYAFYRISSDRAKLMYGVMSAVALKDLDWEVQIAALDFWDCAIKKNWLSRGMIDGTFPSVTFSKQKRKIITFNDEEIQRQINGTMKDLSCTGCLNVLYTCLNNEGSVEIMEVAYRIVRDLMEILDRYKFSQVQNISNPNSNSSEDIEYESATSSDISHGSPINEALHLRDNVIDDILNTNLCELIVDINSNNREASLNKNTNYNYPKISPKDVIDPNKFIAHFKSTDYLHIIDKKKKWNPGSVSLDDLIEDILNSEKMAID